MGNFRKFISVILVLVTLLLFLNYQELRENNRLQNIIINGIYNCQTDCDSITLKE